MMDLDDRRPIEDGGNVTKPKDFCYDLLFIHYDLSLLTCC